MCLCFAFFFFSVPLRDATHGQQEARGGHHRLRQVCGRGPQGGGAAPEGDPPGHAGPQAPGGRPGNYPHAAGEERLKIIGTPQL